MARETGRDFGIGAGRLPIWLHDNPFWRRALASDRRRSLLAGRLLLTLLLLSAIMGGAFWTEQTYPHHVTFFLRMFRSPLNWAGWALTAVSFAHVICILAARSAFALSLGLEAERQTLPMLLLVPPRRTELSWASAVPPAAAALIVALAGLPLYLLLLALGGGQWSDLGALYLLFLLIAFSPPLYLRPALSADPAPIARTDRAARGRRATGNPAAFLPSFLYMIWVLGRALPSIGGWGMHLTAALPASVSPLGLVIFAWPLAAGLLLVSPLPFFGGHLPPLSYILPLLLAGWMVSALRTGAALAAGDPADLARLPIARRATTLSRWAGRFAAFFLLAFAWQPWVRSGDIGRLAGAFAPTVADDLAGLLLVLGSLAILSAVWTIPAAVFGGPGRSLRLTARHVRRRAGRPLRRALLLFGLACLCGGASPFVLPVLDMLARLCLVAASALVCVTGFWVSARARLARGRAITARDALRPAARIAFLLLAGPFVALSLPMPGPLLAALSPVTAWLELYPGSSAAIQTFPYWTLSPLPPFPLALAAPFLMGCLLASVTLRPRRIAAPALAKTRSASDDALTPRNAAQTAALVAWMSARTDNPLFLRELRARTRSGAWVNFLYFTPLWLFVTILGMTYYPVIITPFRMMSALQVLRMPGLFSGTLPTAPEAYGGLAALILSFELYLLGLRGQMVGEGLLLRDSERGTLHQLLITPLPTIRILAGMAWGQSLAPLFVWAICAVASLLLYVLSAIEYGLAGPLTAWAVSQVMVLAGYALGVALGAAWAPLALRYRMLRGFSILFGLLFYFGAIRLSLSLEPVTWSFGHGLPSRLFTALLLQLAAAALALSAPILAFAHARIAALRRGDMKMDSLTG